MLRLFVRHGCSADCVPIHGADGLLVELSNGLGFIPSLGVADLQTEVAALQTAVEKVTSQTLDTVKAVKGELSTAKQVALQNREALDLLLAEKGAIVGKECCTYIPDSSQAVQDLEDAVHKQLSEMHEEHGLFEYSWDNWFSSLAKSLMFLRAPSFPYVDDPPIPAWLYGPQPPVVINVTSNTNTAGDSCSIQPPPARFCPLRFRPEDYYTVDSDYL